MPEASPGDRKRRREGRDNPLAGDSSRIRRMALGIWFRLAVIAVAIVFGGLELYRARVISPEPPPAHDVVRPHARAEIRIEGMDCMMCAAGLQNKLRTLRGVSKAEVSYQDQRAAIEFDPTSTSRARLVEAIEGEGFKVAAQDASPRAVPPSGR
jgi:copper chaperone